MPKARKKATIPQPVGGASWMRKLMMPATAGGARAPPSDLGAALLPVLRLNPHDAQSVAPASIGSLHEGQRMAVSTAPAFAAFFPSSASEYSASRSGSSLFSLPGGWVGAVMTY